MGIKQAVDLRYVLKGAAKDRPNTFNVISSIFVNLRVCWLVNVQEYFFVSKHPLHIAQFSTVSMDNSISRK
jgi:hypothetical protein